MCPPSLGPLIARRHIAARVLPTREAALLVRARAARDGGSRLPRRLTRRPTRRLTHFARTPAVAGTPVRAIGADTLRQLRTPTAQTTGVGFATSCHRT